MAIGTSLDTYYDSELHQQAGVENEKAQGITITPVNPIDDKTPNIDDRRDQEDYAKPKWENVLPNLRDMGVSLGNKIWGTPQIPESDQSELSDALGREDIKIEPNIGDSLLQRGVDDVYQAGNFFKGIYHAIKGEEYKPFVPPELSNDTSFSEGTKVGNKLFGLNGEERHQLWPERMIRGVVNSAHEVASGQVPGWSRDPETGEYHTSTSMIEHGFDLMPAMMSGTIPGRIRLEAPRKVTDALKPTEAPNPPSFGERLDQRLAEQRREFEASRDTPPANMDNHEWAQFEGEMDAMLRDIRSVSERRARNPFEQEPFRPDYENYGRAQQFESEMNSLVSDMRQRDARGLTNTDLPEIVHNGRSLSQLDETEWQSFLADIRNDRPSAPSEPSAQHYIGYESKSKNSDNLSYGRAYISRIRSPYAEHPTSHMFKFYDEPTGETGRLSIVEKNGGKQIYVRGIGLQDAIDPQAIGFKGMKDLLYVLKMEFPEAETIAGFRVSGARGKNTGPAHAEMKLPKLKQPAE